MSVLTESLAFGISERGNTSLRNCETGGAVFYYQAGEDGVWLEIAHIPDNYPAWNISTTYKTLAEIRTHIEENFSDPWMLEKNNIGVNADGDYPICLEDVIETIIYNFKDTIAPVPVEDIHSFLESKEWSMDITDIENVRQMLTEDSE